MVPRGIRPFAYTIDLKETILLHSIVCHPFSCL
jgi:hypothetical protein